MSRHKSDVPQVGQWKIIENVSQSNKGIGLGLGIEFSDLWDVRLLGRREPVVLRSTWRKVWKFIQFRKKVGEIRVIVIVLQLNSLISALWMHIFELAQPKILAGVRRTIPLGKVGGEKCTISMIYWLTRNGQVVEYIVFTQGK